MNDEYSGDVTLDGEQRTPVAIEDPEDVFVRSDGVDGRLEIRNAEWVFSATPVEASVTVDPEKRIAGDLEDGYVDTDGVHGDALLDTPEDVFVAYGATEGIDADGVEQVFHDDTAPTTPPSACDASVTGYQRSRTVESPDTGVVLTGGGHEVTVTDPPKTLAVHVVGYDHALTVEGETDLTVHFVGRDNAVAADPYVDVTVGSESGFDNAVDEEPLPPEAVIDTEKSEAYGDVTVGRARVTYQKPTEDDRCPHCGESADAVVERHYRDAFFLFGYPLYTFEHGVSGHNCESCVRPGTATGGAFP